MLKRVLVLLTCVLGVLGYRHGDGTAYSGDYSKDDTGYNSCQFGELDDRWERYYAALPSHVFDRKNHCGRCIRIKGVEDDAPGKWVKAMIVDECASCHGDGDVDMSIRALKECTGYGWDRKRIKWGFTKCGSTRDNTEDDDDTDNDGKEERD